ncbi:hypothetical protein BaRGS_00003955, partial [Batillaria attramentaria]
MTLTAALSSGLGVLPSDPGSEDSEASKQLSGLKEELHQLKQQFRNFVNSAGRMGSFKRSDDAGPLEAVVAQQAQELSALKAQLQATEARLQAAESKVTSLQNSQGVAGGSWQGDYGGAANRLCLSLEPQFDGVSFDNSVENKLHGAEYYFPGHTPNDVPCCVCRAPYPTTIMLPGTFTCPPGWVPQYTGHVTAGNRLSKAASEFLCLDGEPEDRQGTYRIDNGAYFEYSMT